MSLADNKAVIQRLWEAVRRRMVPVELFADDYVSHSGGATNDRAHVEAAASAFYSAFPDLDITVHDLIAEGDKVVSRYTGTGTHQGEFMGLAATGKRVSWTATVTSRLLDGKIAEEWENLDALGLLQQLGAIPASTEAPVEHECLAQRGSR